MKKTKINSERVLFVLLGSDEMRYPYETALQSVCSKVVWFNSMPSLIQAGTETSPIAVVVDLDSIPKPLVANLEQLRAAFPQSDLVAQSSADSAQIALQCLRSGFTDFLLKPISPEELCWSLRKSLQRAEVFQKLEDPQAKLVRAVTQISSCNTPTLVRLNTLEILQTLLKGQGAAWLEPDRKAKKQVRVLCSVPRNASAKKILAKIPPKSMWHAKSEPFVSVSKTEKTRKLTLPCNDSTYGFAVIWGIPEKLTNKQIRDAKILYDHSEICLLNLSKFEELKQQTFVDDLTGLYNSRYLKFAITNAVAKCRAPGHAFSVLFIDVDHFKSVNDHHGHLVGSEFLVAIAKTIRNTVRQIDPVFRYGGDEFVVILQGSPTQEAKEVAERIRKHVERRVFVFGKQRVQTTVSIGVATYPTHASDQETLLKLADEAMYSAKKTSRNTVHLALGVDEKTPARRTAVAR